MEIAIPEIPRSVQEFKDACRWMFVAAERWNNGTIQQPVDGVDWKALRELDRKAIIESLQSLESAVIHLNHQCGELPDSLPDQWITVIRAAAGFGKLALSDAQERGWFEGRFGVVKGSSVTLTLRKAAGLLSDIPATIRSEHEWHDEYFSVAALVRMRKKVKLSASSSSMTREIAREIKNDRIRREGNKPMRLRMDLYSEWNTPNR